MTELEITNFQNFYEAFTVQHQLYPQNKKEYDEKYKELLEKADSLKEALTGFTVFVGDGHTNMEIPYHAKSLCVNAFSAWEEDGLRIVDGKCSALKPDDKILSIGGNSNIINEFLQYLKIDKFRHYQIYERDGMGLKCIQSRTDYQRNNRNGWSDYNGEIICQIGSDTFSSARMFATILQDNRIALLSGTPSGGKPSSCGQPGRYCIINEKSEAVHYRISTRLFLRPNGELDEQEALLPDIPVELQNAPNL